MLYVRCMYLFCKLVLTLALLSIAVAAPVWITPGYYWWTGFALLLLVTESAAFTKRIEKWGDL